MKTLTIFTPTFNRASLLPRLYDSLKAQTNQDFVWMIINDGSSDNTDEVVKSFLEENFLGLRNISNNKTTHLNVSEDGSKFIKIKQKTEQNLSK